MTKPPPPHTHNVKSSKQCRGQRIEALCTAGRKRRLRADERRQADALGRHKNAVLEQKEATGTTHSCGQVDGASADGQAGHADAHACTMYSSMQS
jgi:hypothetical protein